MPLIIAKVYDVGTVQQLSVPDLVSFQTFLAFDYGVRRIGVASGNRLLNTAQPRGVLVVQRQMHWQKISNLVHEWAPDALVVGIPYHPDGAEHKNTRRAREFCNQLLSRYKKPILQVDERYSTASAWSEGADEKNIDAISACVILNQLLTYYHDAENKISDN